MKRINWVLPHTVKGAPILEHLLSIVMRTNQERKGYKSGKLCKMCQNSYVSDQKSEYRNHSLYITYIRSYICLLTPLAQCIDKIDQLLIGNMLEASIFHKKHNVYITWQEAKEIIWKCPTCSLYSQTTFPAGNNSKSS